MAGRKRLAVLLLSACANGPALVVERRYDPAPAPRGPALLQAAMMRAHTVARRVVGLPPLTWSEALAASARGHAEEMARTGRFAHAVQPMDRTRQGARRLHLRRDDRALLAEQRDFVDVATPGFSRTGRWQDVGHYTQIVWRGTTVVGCAVASDQESEYLVCRYGPPGNVMGQKAF